MLGRIQREVGYKNWDLKKKNWDSSHIEAPHQTVWISVINLHFSVGKAPLSFLTPEPLVPPAVHGTSLPPLALVQTALIQT